MFGTHSVSCFSVLKIFCRFRWLRLRVSRLRSSSSFPLSTTVFHKVGWKVRRSIIMKTAASGSFVWIHLRINGQCRCRSLRRCSSPVLRALIDLLPLCCHCTYVRLHWMVAKRNLIELKEKQLLLCVRTKMGHSLSHPILRSTSYSNSSQEDGNDDDTPRRRNCSRSSSCDFSRNQKTVQYYCAKLI